MFLSGIETKGNRAESHWKILGSVLCNTVEQYMIRMWGQMKSSVNEYVLLTRACPCKNPWSQTHENDRFGQSKCCQSPLGITSAMILATVGLYFQGRSVRIRNVR